MNEQLIGFAFPFRIVPADTSNSAQNVADLAITSNPGCDGIHAAGGGISRACGFKKIEQDVRHLLSTRLGERVMLRTYGGGVHHRLQDSNDVTLRALIKYEIEQALRLYLPNVQLTVPILLSSQEEELHIIIEYRANPRDLVRSLELQIP